MGWTPKGCNKTRGKFRTPTLKKRYMATKKRYMQCVMKHCHPKNMTMKEMLKDKNIKCSLKHCRKEGEAYVKASYF